MISIAVLEIAGELEYNPNLFAIYFPDNYLLIKKGVVPVNPEMKYNTIQLRTSWFSINVVTIYNKAPCNKDRA